MRTLTCSANNCCCYVRNVILQLIAALSAVLTVSQTTSQYAIPEDAIKISTKDLSLTSSQGKTNGSNTWSQAVFEAHADDTHSSIPIVLSRLTTLLDAADRWATDGIASASVGKSLVTINRGGYFRGSKFLVFFVFFVHLSFTHVFVFLSLRS